VITNSPPIAVALAEHPAVQVTMLGGTLAKDAQAVVGAATVEALHAIRADVLVLGVCSLHPEVGVTVMDLEESYVKRAMIENAAEVVAVSSADKLGSAGPYVSTARRRRIVTGLGTGGHSRLQKLGIGGARLRSARAQSLVFFADGPDRLLGRRSRRSAADRTHGGSSGSRCSPCRSVRSSRCRPPDGCERISGGPSRSPRCSGGAALLRLR
jgi:hypothetical protein